MSIIKQGQNYFAIFIAIGRISAMLASFAMPLFLTRFLAKEDYGLYSQFYTILIFLGSIFAFGVQSNLYFFYPTASSHVRSRLVYNTILSLFLFGLMSALVLYIPLIKRLFLGNGDLNTYFYFIPICLFFFVPSSIIEPLFVVRKDRICAALIPPLEVILKLIIVISAALLFGNLKSIFISITILQAVIFLFAVLYSLKEGVSLDIRHPNTNMLKQQLAYGLPFGLAVILNTLSRQFDKVVCISFLNAEEYAIYTIAFFGIPGIIQIYDSLGQVILINITKSHQEGRKDEVLTQYKNFVTKALSFSLPIIFVVFLYSKEIIIFLFTDKYVEAIPFFRIYILSFIVAMLGGGIILRAIGNTSLILKAYILSSLLSLPLTYFMIKNFGSWGAIIGAMVAINLPKILQIYYEMRELNISLGHYLPWVNLKKIVVYSSFWILPFIVIHLLFDFNVYFCGTLAVLYIGIVYYMEINENIFIIHRQTLDSYYKQIIAKLGR